MSPTDQSLFLERFSVLNLAQQTYAYNQFLSTPPEIQKFAISQFLSLDPEVLIVSIQAEIDREARLGSPPQFQARTAAPRQQPRAILEQQQVIQEVSPQQGVRRSDTESVGSPSLEEQRAIQQQLEQQAEARRILKVIVDRQTEVNRRHLMGSVAQ